MVTIYCVEGWEGVGERGEKRKGFGGLGKEGKGKVKGKGEEKGEMMQERS